MNAICTQQCRGGHLNHDLFEMDQVLMNCFNNMQLVPFKSNLYLCIRPTLLMCGNSGAFSLLASTNACCSVDCSDVGRSILCVCVSCVCRVSVYLPVSLSLSLSVYFSVSVTCFFLWLSVNFVSMIGALSLANWRFNFFSNSSALAGEIGLPRFFPS